LSIWNRPIFYHQAILLLFVRPAKTVPLMKTDRPIGSVPVPVKIGFSVSLWFLFFICVKLRNLRMNFD